MTIAMDPIDVVVTWVDESDVRWRASRDFHLGRTPTDSPEAASAERYRDWRLLKYWLRGIAENCPWARTIFLVTDNDPPDWLNADAPRLKVVRHSDFIPQQFLPTFNSRAIELNLHRLPGISQHFVYFNDDMFVLRPLLSSHFFRKGQPVAFAVQNALSIGDSISHAMLNNVDVLNSRFIKRRVIANKPLGWFSPSYGIHLLQNVALLPWPRFTGFHNHHLPIAMRRDVMERLWAEIPDELNRTCGSKFRQFTDVNPFLVSWWSICEGEFAPGNIRRYGRYIQLGLTDAAAAAKMVRRAETPVICINDGPVRDFDTAMTSLQRAFEFLYPLESEFEVSSRGKTDPGIG